MVSLFHCLSLKQALASKMSLPTTTVPACENGTCSSSPSNLKLYQTLIFAMPVLFTVVLILLFWLLYLRRRRTAQAATRLRAHFFARSLFTVPSDRGLGKSFRDGLPVIVFDESFAAKEDNSQCPICLGEYELHERLQQLPVCGHFFHIDCIGEWLCSNSTCPVCRCTLVPTSKVVPFGSPANQPFVLTGVSGAASVDRGANVDPGEACEHAQIEDSMSSRVESHHAHALSIDVMRHLDHSSFDSEH